MTKNARIKIEMDIQSHPVQIPPFISESQEGNNRTNWKKMKIMCELNGLVVFNLGKFDCHALRTCTEQNYCQN